MRRGIGEFECSIRHRHIEFCLLQDRDLAGRFKSIMTNALRDNVHLTQAFFEHDLQQILALQKANLAEQISETELQQEGFVTVKHDLKLLKALNEPNPHIIAKLGEEVIGYALVMSAEKADTVPVLIPMFEQIEKLTFEGQRLGAGRYVVMGQICIAKAYRGQGLFKALYLHMQACLQAQFPYVITEVSDRNKRSLRAHQKVGFHPLEIYNDPSGERWHLLLWDWDKRSTKG